MGDKLKLGILDLLTILVPGGFLLIFIRPYLQGYIEIIAGSFPTLSTKDPVLYAGFIAIAYILGGFIYFIASYLDDWIYENVSKVFWPNPALTAYIIDFKARQTGIPSRKVINAFKWSCGWLLKHHQPMYDEVERVMAESKFFRSMILVSVIAACIIIRSHPLLSIPLFILTLFSLVRYLTQRKKSINMAYEYIITAHEKQFKQQPDPEAYYEISRRYITVACDPEQPYEHNRSRELTGQLSCFFKKLGKVLELCLNPFYSYPVAPQGAPSSKSTEIRWFSRHGDDQLAEWFDENMQRVTGTIEKRTDIYYVNSKMKDMSIKKRNGQFEIKQRIAATGKIYLSDSVCGYEEYWYKWILNDAAGKALAGNLEQHHYRQLAVTKIRRALKLTIDPANVLIMIHAPHEDLREGFQIEYTSITMNNGQESETWYSFAIESFGSTLPALSALQGLAMLTQVRMRPEDSCAYPEFLARNFIN